MHDVAAEAVNKTEVGQPGSMRPTTTTAEALDTFQAVVLEADRLHADGVIAIHNKHRESQTGKQYVDLVTFTRLR